MVRSNGAICFGLGKYFGLRWCRTRMARSDYALHHYGSLAALLRWCRTGMVPSNCLDWRRLRRGMPAVMVPHQ
ncbi:hypothetical protein ACIGXI_27850 [Kitasatospora aureofaciens]|uniref:hypothetical protein n=1 Tax=Kitasatospora aureofaciens TaxID=1894 RepID=UPI0037C90F0A